MKDAKGGKAALKKFLPKVIVGFILLFGVGSCYTLHVSSRDTVRFVVTGKERIEPRNGDGHYLVFSKDETFKNVDSTFFLKWNSSDVQGSLLEGAEYEADVYGWRMPWFSWYRNIIRVREVK